MTAILPDFSNQIAAPGSAAPASAGAGITPQLLAGVANFPALLDASLTVKMPKEVMDLEPDTPGAIALGVAAEVETTSLRPTPIALPFEQGLAFSHPLRGPFTGETGARAPQDPRGLPLARPETTVSARVPAAIELEVEPAKPARLPLPFDPEPVARKLATAPDPVAVESDTDTPTDSGKPSPAGGTILPCDLPVDMPGKLANISPSANAPEVPTPPAEPLRPRFSERGLRETRLAPREGAPITLARAGAVDAPSARVLVSGGPQAAPTGLSDTSAATDPTKPQAIEVQPDPAAPTKSNSAQAITGAPVPADPPLPQNAADPASALAPATLHARAVLATVLKGEEKPAQKPAQPMLSDKAGPQALRDIAGLGQLRASQSPEPVKTEKPVSENAQSTFVLPEVSRAEPKAPPQTLASGPAPAVLAPQQASPDMPQTPIQQHAITPPPVQSSAPAAADTRAVQPAPAQLENTISQLAEARETGRSARPELTVRHSEFGSINVRLEAAGSDLRATVSARDPGFVPAIQAALAERGVVATSDTSSNQSQRGHDQSGAQQQSHNGSAFAGGQSDGRYGSSTGSGHASPQPYRGQDGANEEETASHGRAARSDAAREDRGNAGLFA